MGNIEFQSKVDMRNFAYEGSIRLNEETVKEAVGAFLRNEGYAVSIGQKRERGADLQATREGRRVIVEAKGEGTRPPMFNNYFLNAVGETLQRMRVGIAEYGIALPAHRKFVRLVVEFPDIARNIVKLNFYLVRPVAGNDYEVGVLRWNVT